MRRTNIYLDDHQVDALRLLAAADRQSMATLVREAVDGYLQQRLVDDTTWRHHLVKTIERIRSRVPSSVTAAEIEADITAARDELRRQRRAARGR
ncbi:MAG: ribbon-helix-helix protein, CopG family [Thermomicrobiales bacterium]